MTRATALRPVSIAGLAAMFCITGSARAGDDPNHLKLEAQLAQRLEGVAYSYSQQQPTAAQDEGCGALGQAASRLDAAEPRYFRLAAERFSRSGDTSSAIAAIKAYLALVPSDQYAQEQLIDLFVGQMETADAIINYLHGVIGKTSLPPSVRAHAAFIAAQTYLSRSQPAEAIKMLDSAIGINPLDQRAVRLKFQLTHDDGPSRRVGMLLAMLRGDPSDALTVTGIASELADAGVVLDSMNWYYAAFNLQSRSPQFVRGGAVEYFLGGHAKDFLPILDEYLHDSPMDNQAWMIRLAIARDANNPGEMQALTSHALVAMGSRFERIRSSLGARVAPELMASGPTSESSTATRPTATTLPVAAIPDLSGDLPLLVKLNRAEVTDAYVAALQDIAWVEIFFNRDAAGRAGPILDQLTKILPDDDAVLARLNGWEYLVKSQTTLARQKLSAVADQDPYAQLGLIVLDPIGMAKQIPGLMAAHPSGLVAATLYSQLRLHGARVLPVGQHDAIEALIASFPHDWLSFVNQPQSFYSVTADPVNAQVDFGQPVLARVTIQNFSELDIPVGPTAALRPFLVFDASLQGILEKQFPHVAYETFWQRTIIPAHQSCTQIIRLDRGDLGQAMSLRPDIPLEIGMSLTTNAGFYNGEFVPGMGGTQTRFASLIERGSVDFTRDDVYKQTLDQASHGDPVQRLDAIDKLYAWSLLLSDQAGSANFPNRAAMLSAINASLEQSTKDLDPLVRAWAYYRDALVSDAQHQTFLAAELAQDGEWTSRLVALLIARQLPEAMQAAAGNNLLKDSDPSVKLLASSLVNHAAETGNPPAPAAKLPGP